MAPPFLVLILCLGFGVAGQQEPATPPAHVGEVEVSVDRRTGLVLAEGFELVRAKCLDCHSSSLIVQTRGRREDWLGLIRWMQATQALAPLGERTEAAILDYLSRHYGVEERVGRRPPLPPELLPPPREYARPIE